MKYVLINYNHTPDWVKQYTDDYLIYDRSESEAYLQDFPKEKVIKTENIGNVDYDRMTYLIDNYSNLPEVFVLAKSNLFKYITEEEFDKVKNNKVFTPLLTKNHKTYKDRFGTVCFYDDMGMYNERNDSWYVHSMVSRYPSYNEFAQHFRLKSPRFLTFAPGGNYILTRETVHKYSPNYYEELRDALGYCQLPAEAHMLERSYYQIWQS